MVNLYGQQWNRRELEARVGRVEQIGGLQRLKLTEGFEAGVEQVQVRTGAGLTYYVTLSKGLDISLAEFGGTPLSWQSANGNAHPAYYNEAGTGWLRTASGGLLMTCGLTQAGRPNTDNGEALGLHGRIHHAPACQVSTEAEWVNDSYEMRVKGVVEETRIFGERLRLTRQIHSRLGENAIAIFDTVENAGFEPTPHMILYHFNFGFPLLTPGTMLEFPSNRVTPRDEGVPLAGYDRWELPQPGYSERVYRHTDLSTKDGWATARVINPAFPLPGGPQRLAVHLRWKTDTLDRFVQWKMAGQGVHVLGIEPANCHTSGRAAERQNNTLTFLAPGEARHYELQLNIFAGPA